MRAINLPLAIVATLASSCVEQGHFLPVTQRTNVESLEVRALSASKMCVDQRPIRYFVEYNVLCVDAPIDISGKLFGEIKSLGLRQGVMLVIKSQGGGVSEAIRITEFLEKYDFVVIVDGICASACAQFVFLGAKEKFIIGSGVLAMHGGPPSLDQIKNMPLSEHQKKNIQKERIRFIEFYKRRHIDISLTTNAPPSVLKRMGGGETIFWIPKRQEFERFGIKNVHFLDALIMIN